MVEVEQGRGPAEMAAIWAETKQSSADGMRSPAINEIAGALALAQGEMQNAKINRINPHFKNRYADLASVRDAIHVALAKHGLATTQTMSCGDETFTLRTTLMHKSGQWIASDYPLPMNAKPQELGSALTYARRYSLTSIVGISADDDDDAEGAEKAGNGPAKTITEDQAGELQALIEDVGADRDKFLKYLAIKKLTDLPASAFANAVSALNAKRQS